MVPYETVVIFVEVVPLGLDGRPGRLYGDYGDGLRQVRDHQMRPPFR